jgi:cell shape-determining protein MreC
LSTVVGLLAICFLAIGAEKTISAIASIGNFIFKAKHSVGQTINNGIELSKSKSTLIEEKRALEEKVQDNEALVAKHTTLEDENAKLTEMLARKKETTELTMARILAKPNQSAYDILLIDVGSEDGITTGAKVLARGDIPIGTVSEVNLHSSRVKLFTTNKEKTQGVIVGKDIFVDLVGHGGGTFQAMLPRDLVVEKGSTVATIDTGETIAIAEESLADPRDPYQKILFRSSVNLFELRFVGVEK